MADNMDVRGNVHHSWGLTSKTSNLLKTPVEGKEVRNALKMSGKSGSLCFRKVSRLHCLSVKVFFFSPRRNVGVVVSFCSVLFPL